MIRQVKYRIEWMRLLKGEVCRNAKLCYTYEEAKEYRKKLIEAADFLDADIDPKIINLKHED